MYQFSQKTKSIAIVLMILGAIGIGIGAFSTPGSEAEVAELLHNAHDAHGGHGSHDAHADTHHVDDAHAEHHGEADAAHNDHEAHDAHVEAAHANTHDGESHDVHATETAEEHAAHATDAHAHETAEAHAAHDAHAEAGHDEHAHHIAHIYHQLKNKPWAAFFVALVFTIMVTIVVFAFLCIQRVAQAGWSIVLFRVMEGIAANLVPVSIIMALFVFATAGHLNHLFVWMGEGVNDPNSPNYDALVTAKKGWLNVPFWVIRCLIYLIGWNIFRFVNRKLSLAQDTAGTLVNYKKNYNVAVGFLAFFIFTESMSVWDWVMGLDPHWFSTLFGWYVFASAVVSALTVIAIVTITLKAQGYLEVVNDSHLHDLAKFMFGFSVFWTYLWFAQFMLIWYSDMPEETVYYIQRFSQYKGLFLALVPLNFILPVLLLINSDYKRISYLIVGTGCIILLGHYLDFFVMIMPATVGESWSFGFAEIGSLLFFIGLFIFTVFKALSKAPLIAKGNPFLHESEHFHY